MYKTSAYRLLVISVRSLALISQIWLKYFKIQDKYIVRTLCSLIISFISSLLFNFASSFCSEITFMNHEISWSTIFDPSTEKVMLLQFWTVQQLYKKKKNPRSILLVQKTKYLSYFAYFGCHPYSFKSFRQGRKMWRIIQKWKLRNNVKIKTNLSPQKTNANEKQ